MERTAYPDILGAGIKYRLLHIKCCNTLSLLSSEKEKELINNRINNAVYYPESGMLHGFMEPVMGTRLDALLFHREKTALQLVWDSITSEIYRLHGILSRFEPESEITRINQKAVSGAVVVSKEVSDILYSCAGYYQKTSGYFDITLQDFSSVELDREKQTVRFHLSSLHIDLGGYAKGYALERIRSILLQYKFQNALINFGNSSVLGIGHHPHGDCWPIGITHPYHPEITVANLQLHDNETLSISGNSPQREKHICNPFTGSCVNDQKIVSVIAPNAIDAEVLSTALFVAPQEKKEIISGVLPIREANIYDLTTPSSSPNF